ncbi:Fimbrillin-like, partial [Prevotellaceae bacterium MN60]
MKYIRLTFLSATVLALASLSGCSNVEEPSVKEAVRHEIRFTSNLTGLDADVTRAYGSFTTYNMGQKFWVWADMYDDQDDETTTYFNAWQLTVSSTTTRFSTNTTKMFPAYNKVSFYTLHGSFSEDFVEETSEVVGSEWPEVLTHTIKTTQITDNDYQLSDLVYAVNRNVVPTSEPVALEFKHLLSQVEVALIAGSGLTADNLTDASSSARATVELLGVKTKVQFRPDKANTMATYAERELMLSNASDPDTITVATVVTDDVSKQVCGAAVVVPQTV